MPEVGIKGQEKLKSAKVLVIGAGGLGSPILQYLTAAGVGTIGILDFDTVSESNLQRQVLFNPEDIGKSKAEVAHQKLKTQNPFTNFIVHNTCITKDNALDIIKDFEIVIDGSDNFPTRFMISDACVILDKPLVFGAIYKFFGQASVFNYKNGPTYRCLFPEQPEEDDIPNCSTIGVIGVIPGIIGTIQANEAIKIILDKGDTLSGRLFQIDALTFNVDILEISRDESAANITELGEYKETCSIEVSENSSYNILPHDLKIKLDNNNAIIYDLRSEHEFINYNIGGELISVENLLNDPNLIPKDKTVVLLCEVGEKSYSTVEYLRENEGISNIVSLQGGIQSWLDCGFKVNL